MEYIDLTPTWEQAANIYIGVLLNGTEEGRKNAVDGLIHMSKVADIAVENEKAKQAALENNDGTWKNYFGWLPEFGNNYPLSEIVLCKVMECFRLLTGAPELSADELLASCPNDHLTAWLDAYLIAWDEAVDIALHGHEADEQDEDGDDEDRWQEFEGKLPTINACAHCGNLFDLKELLTEFCFTVGAPPEDAIELLKQEPKGRVKAWLTEFQTIYAKIEKPSS